MTITEFRHHKPPRLDALSREELATYFTETWELYEWLFSSIRADGAIYEKTDPLRQPLIFYLGHTAAFYVNKLRLAGLRDGALHERFDPLFAVGVDPASAGELEAQSWPTEAEVRTYRAQVREIVLEQIETVALDLPVTESDPAWALLMGLEHDRIHFETSSVLIRQYRVDAVERPDGWSYAPIDGGVRTSDPIAFEGGRAAIGKPTDDIVFGWDHEYGHLARDVAPFAVASTHVTNGAFLEFWGDDGYGREELWTAEGWAWRSSIEARAPRFWVVGDDRPSYRAMFDGLELPESWPVEVNRHEAEAFCRWKGEGWRLPSEHEFAALSADASLIDGNSAFADAYNLNITYGSPTPVGFMTGATTPSGVHDVFGNVWQWLSDEFYPLPEFKTHYLYEDFSAPFMDSEHGMLAGGAWASSGASASRFYRLWFRPNFFQHAGFRLARDA
ncbi:MAG: 5-histidylcysteine sulfoxide synthase [Gemmatimonadetes bacterium]|nr:5-histidylcysteine sulfoxide synthase [Gemmatimonadota bacterium]